MSEAGEAPAQGPGEGASPGPGEGGSPGPGEDPASGDGAALADAPASASPWRPVAVRVAYENPWIRVEHHDVIRPDGAPGIYGVVRFHHAAVGIVALDDRGQVLLVGQWRYALDRYSWEIPEGGVPPGASLLEGARRELAEETGFRAAEWRELLRFALSNSVTDEEGAVFVARGLEAGVASPEPTEELAVRWVPLGDAVAMVDRGEISDVLSQVGILRVALEMAAG